MGFSITQPHFLPQGAVFAPVGPSQACTTTGSSHLPCPISGERQTPGQNIKGLNTQSHVGLGQYRPDIDGLRAIAVLSLIDYHL